MIMVAAKDQGGGKKKKAEFVEQRFRITKKTTFDELKIAACDFWALDNSKFNLYDENLHDLMSLNQDPNHPAHRVEQYFKIIMVKSLPTFLLRKPDRETNALLPNQRDAIRIRYNNGPGRVA